MPTPRTPTALPLPVQRTLRKLGSDVAAARKRRRITMQLMAERAATTRQTIARLERGDPGVSLGIYVTALFVLGLSDKLAAVADATADPYLLDLDEERLPTRVRPRRSP